MAGRTEDFSILGDQAQQASRDIDETLVANDSRELGAKEIAQITGGADKL